MLKKFSLYTGIAYVQAYAAAITKIACLSFPDFFIQCA